MIVIMAVTGTATAWADNIWCDTYTSEEAAGLAWKAVDKAFRELPRARKYVVLTTYVIEVERIQKETGMKLVYLVDSLGCILLQYAAEDLPLWKLEEEPLFVKMAVEVCDIVIAETKLPILKKMVKRLRHDVQSGKIFDQ